MNSISANIKAFVVCSVIILYSCNGDDKVKEIENTATLSEQESFAIKLTKKGMLCNDSLDNLRAIISSITGKTRFHGHFQINKAYDSGYLNFYIVNSRSDSSLRNLCAYAGKNIIFLDRYFLDHYLDSNKFLSITGGYDTTLLHKAFQNWVIGHEIAHADLFHNEGHFIKSSKPKTQNEAWKFHTLELQADKHCMSYFGDIDRKSFGQMLVAVFNEDFNKTYLEVEPNSKFKYLKMDNDDYMTYPYKLGGSHSTMAIRTAVFIYMMTANKTLKEESHLFLLKSQLHIINDLIDLSEDSIQKISRGAAYNKN